MKVIIAPNSFRDSLSAIRVCKAMAHGVLKVVPDAEIVQMPVADGGEGTVQTMVRASRGKTEKVKVTGPIGEPVMAEYGILGDGLTAVIGMAAASGLELIPVQKRNPLRTTTVGTGELIRVLLDRGFRKIIVGIGGSATTDCGTGAAQALGVKFFRKNGEEIRETMTGRLMAEVADVDIAGLHPKIRECEILVACDVENPLLGEHGAVMTYSRQKGASDEDLLVLENGMRHLVGIIESSIGRSIWNIPGAGAAGGMGAGLIAFLNAKLIPGIELVLDVCRFEEKIIDADLIFTGEGKVDAQTASGKAVMGVAQIAKRHAVPAVVIAGQIGSGIENLYSKGITSVFSICPGPMSLEQAFQNTEHLVSDCAERIMRLYVSSRKSK
jgi:glycerate kinase